MPGTHGFFCVALGETRDGEGRESLSARRLESLQVLCFQVCRVLGAPATQSPSQQAANLSPGQLFHAGFRLGSQEPVCTLDLLLEVCLLHWVITLGAYWRLERRWVLCMPAFLVQVTGRAFHRKQTDSPDLVSGVSKHSGAPLREALCPSGL